MGNSLGQYCLNVSDLERSVAFYTDVLGLELHSRTQIPGTNEAIVWGRGKGSALQLAEHHEKTSPIDQSPEAIKKVGALWKLYLCTDDVQALHAKAVAAGAKSVVEPMHLEQWDVWVAFVEDPDGYQVELIQGMDLDANAPS